MKIKTGYFWNNFQLIVFSITYVLSIIFLYSIFIYLTREIDLIYRVFGTLIILIGGILNWAFLIVLFKLPQKMAGAFDQIKNKIANKEITNSYDFSAELSGFLLEFFNFTFFDVEYSAVKILKEKVYCSSEKIKETIQWNDNERFCLVTPDLQKHGRTKIGKSFYYGYTIPIHFGDTYLGYFTVFTKQKLGNMSLKQLADLENNFVDDQLMHVMSGKE